MTLCNTLTKTVQAAFEPHALVTRVRRDSGVDFQPVDPLQSLIERWQRFDTEMQFRQRETDKLKSEIRALQEEQRRLASEMKVQEIYMHRVLWRNHLQEEKRKIYSIGTEEA